MLATGQFTIIDLNDAIISGDPPENPTVGTLWIKEIPNRPDELYVWTGQRWADQQLSLGNLDPDQNDKINDSVKQLDDLGSDAVITVSERIKIKESVEMITGAMLTDTEDLPTVSFIDGTIKKGGFYTIRKEARDINISTSATVYSDLTNKYNALRTYLNAFSPKPWNVYLDSTISVTPSEWRSKWLDFNEAITALRGAITAKINDTTTELDTKVTENDARITVLAEELDFTVKREVYIADQEAIDQLIEDAKSEAATAKSDAAAAQVAANNAKSAADAAQTKATTAETKANTANSLLSDLANDNKLTPGEKQETKKEWDIIQGEKATIEAQATIYGITTEKSTYTSAYNALNTYITPLLSSLTSTSTIVGTTFRSTFKTYYDAKTALLKKISDMAKDKADAAQGTADTAKQKAEKAQGDVDDVKTDTEALKTRMTEAEGSINIQAEEIGAKVSTKTYNEQMNLYNTRLEAAELKIRDDSIIGVVTDSYAFQQQTQDIANAKSAADAAKAEATIAKADASNAQTAANAAQTKANSAETKANSANSLLADIASDSKFTPSEKQETKKEWDIIKAEYPTIVAQATTYGITTEKNNFVNAYNALNSYISLFLDSLSTTSDINGDEFRLKFKTYYDTKTILLKRISDLAKSRADAAQSKANTADTKAANAQSAADAAQAAADALEEWRTVAEGRFEVLSNKIESSVTNLEIGMANLMSDSYLQRPTSYGSGTVEITDSRPTNEIKCMRSSTGTAFGYTQEEVDRVIQVKSNQRYMLSFEVRGSVAKMDYVYLMNNDGSNKKFEAEPEVISETEYTRIVLPITGFDSDTAYIMISSKEGASDAWFEIRKVKFEAGDKATGWTQGILDLEESLINLATGLSNAQEVITADGIFNTVREHVNFQALMESKANTEELGKYATSEDLENAANDIRKDIDGAINQIDFSKYVTQTDFEQSKDSFNFLFQSANGVNLLRNSIGYADTQFWDKSGAVGTVQNLELEQRGYGSGFSSSAGASGYIEQLINVTPGTPHTISFLMKKTRDSSSQGWAGAEVLAGGSNLSGELLKKGSNTGVTNGYERFEFTFTVPTTEVLIRLTFGTNVEAIVTGLMVNQGSQPLQWSHAPGEMYNSNILMNKNGLKVFSSVYKGYTSVSPVEFSGYAEVEDETGTPQLERVFTLNRDVTEVSKLYADKEIAIGSLKIVAINSGSVNGIAFIPNS